MYLHLGDNYIIPTKDLIGILDLDVVTVSSAGRTYLQQAERNGKLVSVSENLPKSFVVCGGREDFRVYISPISASTLVKRLSRTYLSGMDSLTEV